MSEPEDVAQNRANWQRNDEECASLGNSYQRYGDQPDYARKTDWVPRPLARAQMAEGHKMPGRRFV